MSRLLSDHLLAYIDLLGREDEDAGDKGRAQMHEMFRLVTTFVEGFATPQAQKLLALMTEDTGEKPVSAEAEATAFDTLVNARGFLHSLYES